MQVLDALARLKASLSRSAFIILNAWSLSAHLKRLVENFVLQIDLTRTQYSIVIKMSFATINGVLCDQCQVQFCQRCSSPLYMFFEEFTTVESEPHKFCAHAHRNVFTVGVPT